MRRLPTFVVAAALLTGRTGGQPDEETAAGGTPTAPAADRASAPPAAGGSPAEQLEEAPAAPAEGTGTITLTGLGELTGPFTGTCAHPDPGTTRFDGRIDTAEVRVTADAAGVRLELVDVGLTQDSALAEGTYEVDGDRVVIDTALVGEGTTNGTVQLELTCAQA